MLLSKVGGFSIGTVTGNLAITGVGFQPKVVLFFWSGCDTNNAIVEMLSKRGTGIAISSSARHCAVTHSEDGAGTGDTGQGTFTDRCIAFLNSAEGDDGYADFVSMDADGFTINRVTAAFFNHRVNYLALGGSSIEALARGNFTEPAGAGSQAITGVGFTPDLLIFMGKSGSNAAATTVDSRTYLGAACRTPLGAIKNMVWTGAANNGSDPTQSMSYCRLGQCSAGFDASVAAISSRFSLTSMDADGFTVNHAEVTGTTARDHLWLAIKGGSWDISSLLTRTDGADIVLSGLGFTPKAALFLSHGKAESADDTPQDHDEFILGAMDSALGQACMEALDVDNVATAETRVQADTVDVYSSSNVSGGGFKAFMSVKSIQAWAGLTASMDDVDTEANFMAVLVGGDTLNSMHRRWLNPDGVHVGI